MSHGEYVEMYKTLDEYFQKQTWLLLTHGKDKNEFDLRYPNISFKPLISHFIVYVLILFLTHTERQKKIAKKYRFKTTYIFLLTSAVHTQIKFMEKSVNPLPVMCRA